MTAIMRYQDVVQDQVREMLIAIKANSGMISKKLVVELEAKYRGQWSAECVNVALLAMDYKPYFQVQATPAQIESLVASTKKQQADVLSDIRALRAAKGK